MFPGDKSRNYGRKVEKGEYIATSTPICIGSLLVLIAGFLFARFFNTVPVPNHLLIRVIGNEEKNLPCVVMPRICPDSLAKTRHRSVQLLCEYIFMTKQCVGVSEGLVHLDSTLKKLDGRVMFLL